MQIVTTHKSTDFDGLASIVAGTIIYPGAIPVIPKNQNPNVKGFVSIHKDVFNLHLPNEIDVDAVDSIVVVDTNSWSRLEGLSRLKSKKNLEVILWDHHVSGDMKPDWKCQEEMGANITLMIRKLKQENKIITPIQATLFLAGLYEDTGNLSFSSSTAEDAYAAAYLLERKADLSILSSFLISHAYGEKQKDVLFEMMNHSNTINMNGYRIAINKVNITGHVGGLSLVVRMYREILNVDAAFGIFIDNDRDRLIVIGRSKSDDLNVGAIMRTLGGGGHPGAGSAMIKTANPDAVEETIMELMQGNQLSTVKVSDLMSYPVHSITSDTTMEALDAFLKDRTCTGVPVVDNGKMVGIISKRDFRKIRKSAQWNSPVKAFMSTNTITIEADKSPIEAARMMIKHDIGRIPIIDEGDIIGIISRSDAMTYFYDLLPD